MRVGTNGKAWTSLATSTHPSHLSCFVKASPVANDTVVMEAMIYSGGLVTDKAKWKNALALPAWTQVNIPVSMNAMSIDSMRVEVTGGKLQGSKIWVDDFSTAQFTGLNRFEQTAGFSVSPNPFSAYTTINISSVRNGNLVLYDAVGKKLFSRPVSAGDEVIISRAGLPAGVYLLQVSNGDNSVYTKKLVILD
jgi:hypothetical protein